MKSMILTGVLMAAALPALAQDGGAQGWQARGALEQYYAHIAAKEYDAAYALWGQDGASSGQTPESFAEGFASTKDVTVFTGPTMVNGGAGSLDAEVPVRIDSTLVDGTVQHFAGTYTMRRVNDVQGATAAQLAWHIGSASIHVAQDEAGGGIPEAMQGRWGLVPADCTSTQGDAKGLMTVGPKTLKFYESRGTLAEVTARSAERIEASFAFEGEGMVWSYTEVLALQDGGHTLTRQEEGDGAMPGVLSYSACD
ncbi:MAG: hypothetical protein ACKVKF_21840 [Rhodobacterales bacterium]